MQRLSWLCLLLALSACSPDKKSTSGAQSTTPETSPYAGIYLDKDDAASLRASGKVTEKTCKEASENGYTMGNAFIVNASGEVRSYYPDSNQPEGKPIYVIRGNRIDLTEQTGDEKLPDDFSLTVSLMNGELIITARSSGKEDAMRLLTSSKEEVKKYFQYQAENCKKKQ